MLGKASSDKERIMELLDELAKARERAREAEQVRMALEAEVCNLSTPNEWN